MDMLVKLYALPDSRDTYARLDTGGIVTSVAIKHHV